MSCPTFTVPICIRNYSTPVAFETVPSPTEHAISLQGWHVRALAYRRLQLKKETIITTILAIAQMVAYYALYYIEVNKRDDQIDKQIDFMKEIDSLNFRDKSMLNKKKASLNIPLPHVNKCADSVRYANDNVNDGVAVDKTSNRLIENTQHGIPHGWSLHDGLLFGSKVSGYSGGVMAANSQRRRESFERNKVSIVRAGQSGMKAVFKANSVLAKYANSTAIYSGLSDLFIQGFNSAGAALGISLGRMSGKTGINEVTVGTNDFNSAVEDGSFGR